MPWDRSRDTRNLPVKRECIAIIFIFNYTRIRVDLNQRIAWVLDVRICFRSAWLQEYLDPWNRFCIFTTSSTSPMNHRSLRFTRTYFTLFVYFSNVYHVQRTSVKRLNRHSTLYRHLWFTIKRQTFSYNSTLLKSF